MLRAAWPHLRAAFVALHITAIVLAALPAPEGGMDRRLWSEPTVQSEFRIWADRLHLEEPTLEQLVWKVAVAWMDARAVFLAPVKPWLEWTGETQVWRMFVGANRFPTRFQLQVRDAGQTSEDAWRTLYYRDDPAHRWHEELWENERFRNGLDRFGWPHYKSFFEEFCDYAAKLALAEEPAAADVRCRIWRNPAPTADDARAGVTPTGGYWWSEVVRSRGKIK
jgi:hypothetical protein